MRPALTPRRSRAKRALYRLFLLLERLHLHVMPRHFYSPVADRGWLRRNPELWRERTGLPGITWDLDAQVEWLRQVCAPYLDEVGGFSFLTALAERGIDFRYGLVEGQVLHCAVRNLAPPLVVEFGSGASTAIIANAASRNRGEGRGETRIVAIDPYAPSQLKGLEGVELLEVPGQLAPPDVLAQLRAGDLLFIDSTHVLKAGSELPRVYLEVLPRLPGGVTIQIHDIYLPYLYSPWVLSDFWDWQETVLLAALLSHNPHLEVLCCQSALHDGMPDRLGEILPDYRPRKLAGGIDEGGADGHFPSSIWLKTT